MKIVCIGRNYVEHAKELQNKVPKEPMFFLKPDSAILPYKNPLYIPEWTNDLHYEVELVVKIDRLGKYIDEKHAHKYYSEIGLGIDFTARDVQAQLKEKGHPWEKSKAFDGSAAVSKRFKKISTFDKPLEEIVFTLEKNGEVVQRGQAKDMIFSIDHLISFCSKFMMFKIGDLLFTGTPAGVGKVEVGDELRCFLEGEEMLRVKIK